MATSLCSLATSSHTLLNNNSPFNEMYDLHVLIYKVYLPRSLAPRIFRIIYDENHQSYEKCAPRLQGLLIYKR